jgi:Rrf2 family iron-sulfur cluster assembly transcriptional regulator
LPGQFAERCQTHDLWSELGRAITFFLDGVTLADVVMGKVRGRAAAPPPAAGRIAAE